MRNSGAKKAGSYEVEKRMDVTSFVYRFYFDDQQIESQ